MDVDPNDVCRVLEHVAATELTPRHGSLRAQDVSEKSRGELVTTADRAAEAALTTALSRLLPGVPVVAEEAAAADASLLDLIATAPQVWLVDPLDGTRNFVDGSTDFAVMVALVRAGETVGAWVYRPADDRMYVAQRGAGAVVNGDPLRRAPAPEAVHLVRGVALARFMGPDQQVQVDVARTRLAWLGPGRACAGVDYPLVAEGEQDFVLFWRVLPWDHAPGALLVSEAGGFVGHLDGAPYAPTSARPGLLVAADVETHRRVAATFEL